MLWCAALASGAVLLVASDMRTRDPDSTLYAKLASDLANQPASRWIAPEWGGAWNQHGLFREHPVGILIPSVLAIRAGFPREQAPYAVNMLYQAAVATVGLRASPAQALFTGASVVAAINSILGGAGVALLAGRVGDLGDGAALTVGGATAVLLFGLHLGYQQRRVANLRRRS